MEQESMQDWFEALFDERTQVMVYAEDGLLVVTAYAGDFSDQILARDSTLYTVA